MSKLRYALFGPVSGWVLGETIEDALDLLVEGEAVIQKTAFPLRREVCPRCDGRGKHDHPAFSNGISAEEMDEDPDFREDYMGGVYDVPCEECDGRNVVEVIDEDGLPSDLLEALHDWYESEAADRREAEAERRMGA